MKYLIFLLFILPSVGLAVCVIESDKIEIEIEEQSKGPAKKKTNIIGLNAYNSHEIVNITYSQSEDSIHIFFKNKSQDSIDFDLERYRKLINDWRKCK